MIEEVDSDDDIRINRMPIQFSSYHAIQLQKDDYPDPPALLIATHGYGQSCKGFIKHFAPFRDKNILVVAPQGMNQFYWKNGRPGFSWMTSYMREYTIPDNLAYMAQLYEQIKQDYAFDEHKVFLLGFSQGVAMAFRFASSGLIKPRGVIACGGDLPPDTNEKLPTLEPYPVLVVHGTQDKTVVQEKSLECIEALTKHNFPVEKHFHDKGHEIPDDAVQIIGNWIEKQING